MKTIKGSRELDFHFGACPECGDMVIMNVESSHWAVCKKHKVRWPVGANLFSAWRDENEEIWQENVKFLEQCRVLEDDEIAYYKHDVKRDVSGMRVEVKPNNMFVTFHCHFCGQHFDARAAWAALVQDDESDMELCLDCLAAGPDGIGDRLRKRADEVREYADWLDEAAAELAQIPADRWATIADYERVAAEQNARMRAAHPDEDYGYSDLRDDDEIPGIPGMSGDDIPF